MRSTRALITGITGFCGRHLAAQLKAQGAVVCGIARRPTVLDGMDELYWGDVSDATFMQAAVLDAQPTHIYHLAGILTPNADLDYLLSVHANGMQNLLEAIVHADLGPAIVVTSSSAVYGTVGTNDIPLREGQPFRPVSNYAVSKVTQEMVAYAYYARHGLKIVRTRSFNLVGPGQPASLVCAAFAQQIAQIEAGLAEPVLRVGNLTAQRDFVDVRDATRAFQLLAQLGKPGAVYNVCAGAAVTIQTMLDLLLAHAKTAIRVEPDPARMRASDVPLSVGKHRRLRAATGWQPHIALEQSLTDLLNWWRAKIRG